MFNPMMYTTWVRTCLFAKIILLLSSFVVNWFNLKKFWQYCSFFFSMIWLSYNSSILFINHIIVCIVIIILIVIIDVVIILTISIIIFILNFCHFHVNIDNYRAIYEKIKFFRQNKFGRKNKFWFRASSIFTIISSLFLFFSIFSKSNKIIITLIIVTDLCRILLI